MAHIGPHQLTHWIGVLLVLPPAVVVFVASWRAYAARRPRHPDPRETP